MYIGIELPWDRPNTRIVQRLIHLSRCFRCRDRVILYAVGIIGRRGIENQIPEAVATEGIIAFPARTETRRLAIGRKSFLGDLLNSYYRKAA
jgi:hypothetical protein